jgi:rhodanese-related sulfurtransferase
MQKKFLKAVLFLFLLCFLPGCYEGYAGPDGEPLKAYLEPEALRVLTENPQDDILIIDVRPANAYKKGHIPTALSFPSSEIMERLNELPKDVYLILYCETGGRAQMVIKKLLEEGYTRLMNWGGYKRWEWDFVQGDQ